MLNLCGKVFAHIDSYRNDCIPNSKFDQIKVNVTHLVDVISKVWKLLWNLANNINIFFNLHIIIELGQWMMIALLLT